MELRSLFAKFFPQINPNFYYRKTATIGSFFKRTETSDMLVRSSVVYQYTCDCCQRSYIGSTMLQMFRRCASHRGVSFRTNRPITKPEKSSIRDHCLELDHPIKIQKISILAATSNISDLRVLESLQIHKCKPALNDYQSAMKLNIV
jgi:hypothetical protein